MSVKERAVEEGVCYVEVAVFGLGIWEIAAILGVALLILGPKKLPELARSLGKGLREFRKATEDFKSTMDDEMHKPETPKIASSSEEQAELLPPETDVPATPVAEAEVPATPVAEAEVEAEAEPEVEPKAEPEAKVAGDPPAKKKKETVGSES